MRRLDGRPAVALNALYTQGHLREVNFEGCQRLSTLLPPRPLRCITFCRMFSGSSQDLDFKTSLAILPPRRLWDEIQCQRVFNDKGFVRWPPHINLLYPFRRDTGSTFRDAAQAATDALSQTLPFKVFLQNFCSQQGVYCYVPP